MIARTILVLFIAISFAESSLGEDPGKKVGHPTFGRRQLDQLLDDRPDMKGVLPEDHPIFRWVAEGFNGDRFGMRVYWLANSPTSGYPSDSSVPDRDTPPFVRISAGAELTPIDKWTVLVFELNNIQGSDQFTKLFEQAVQGTISGKEYATGCVQTEFETAVMTQAFFQENRLPPSDHGRDHRYNEVISRPSMTFEEYRKECQAKDSPFGNFDYFLQYYEKEIVPVVIGDSSRNEDNE